MVKDMWALHDDFVFEWNTGVSNLWGVINHEIFSLLVNPNNASFLLLLGNYIVLTCYLYNLIIGSWHDQPWTNFNQPVSCIFNEAN